MWQGAGAGGRLGAELGRRSEGARVAHQAGPRPLPAARTAAARGVRAFGLAGQPHIPVFVLKACAQLAAFQEGRQVTASARAQPRSVLFCNRRRGCRSEGCDISSFPLSVAGVRRDEGLERMGIQRHAIWVGAARGRAEGAASVRRDGPGEPRTRRGGIPDRGGGPGPRAVPRVQRR